MKLRPIAAPPEDAVPIGLPPAPTKPRVIHEEGELARVLKSGAARGMGAFADVGETIARLVGSDAAKGSAGYWRQIAEEHQPQTLLGRAASGAIGLSVEAPLFALPGGPAARLGAAAARALRGGELAQKIAALMAGGAGSFGGEAAARGKPAEEVAKQAATGAVVGVAGPVGRAVGRMSPVLKGAAQHAGELGAQTAALLGAEAAQGHEITPETIGETVATLGILKALPHMARLPKEVADAARQRKQQAGDRGEHPAADAGGVSAEAGRGDRAGDGAARAPQEEVAPEVLGRGAEAIRQVEGLADPLVKRAREVAPEEQAAETTPTAGTRPQATQEAVMRTPVPEFAARHEAQTTADFVRHETPAPEVITGEPKREGAGEAAKAEPERITFEDYAARRGVSPTPPSFPEYHRKPGGASKASERAAAARVERAMAEWQAALDRVREEYNREVAEGRIVPPSNTEILMQRAHGEGPAAEAARRVLAKREARRKSAQEAEGDARVPGAASNERYALAPDERPVVRLSVPEFIREAQKKGINALRRAVREYARAFVGKRVRNEHDGSEILITWQGIKHGTYDKKSAVEIVAAASLPEMLQKSVYVGTSPDRRGRPEIKAVHYYETAILHEGRRIPIRIVVRELADGKRYYDHLEIKKEGNNALLAPQGGTRMGTSGDPAAHEYTQPTMRAPSGHTIEDAEPRVKPDADRIRAALRDAFGRIPEALEKKEKFRIVATEAELPEHLQGAGGRIQGVHDPETGAVWLVAENMRPEEAPAVLAHEFMHDFAATEQGKAVLDKLAELERRAREGSVLADWFARAQARVPEGTPPEHRLEEIAAYAVQEYVARRSQPMTIRRWAQEFLARVKAFLIRKGFPPAWLDDATLAEIAVQHMRAARERVGSGDSGEATFARMSNDEIDALLEPLAEDAMEAAAPIGDGRFQTPIGEVRLGQNQLEKMKVKGREADIPLIRPTLERPIAVFRDERGALVFLKPFVDNGLIRFVSVAYRIDGQNIVVSSYRKRAAQIAALLEKGEPLYMTTALGDKLPRRNSGSADSIARAADGGKQGGEGSRYAIAKEVSEQVAEAVRTASARPTIAAITELARTVGKLLYYKPVSMLRIANTPTARALADMIYKDRPDGAPDLFQLRHRAEATFARELERALEPVRGRLGIPQARQRRIIAALNGERVSLAPEEAEAVRRLRAWLRVMLEYQRRAGVDIGEIADYFPRVYDTRKLFWGKGRDEFVALLKRHGYENADAIWARIVSNEGILAEPARSERLIVDDSGQVFARRALSVGGARVMGHERARKLDIPYRELAPFLVHDLEAVLARYLHHAVVRAEYARLFGPDEGRLNAMVRRIIEEYRDQYGGRIPPISLRDLVEHIYELADALQGIRPGFSSPRINATARAIANVETMIHLPLVVFSSIPETIMPLAQVSPRAWARGLAAAISAAWRESANAVAKKVLGRPVVEREYWRDWAERIGAILPEETLGRASLLYSGVSGALTTRFMRLTMLEQLTNMQRVLTTRAAIDDIRALVGDLDKGGRKAARARALLREVYGLAPEEARSFVDSGFDPDHPATLAVQRFVQRIITTPTEAQIPLKLQHRGWNLVFQFKRFITAFGNTFLKDVGRRIAVEKRTGGLPAYLGQFLAAVALSTAAAWFAQMIRDAIKYSPEDRKRFLLRKDLGDPMRVLDALDRAGWTGPLSQVYQTANPYRFGGWRSGEARLVSLSGPLGSDVARVFEVYGLLGREGESPARRIGRIVAGSIPVVNAAWPTRDALAKQIAELLQ